MAEVRKRHTKGKGANAQVLMSTLDVLNGKKHSSMLEIICQTGDILMYANPCELDNYYKVVAAFGGDAVMERRLPIIHAAMVIKDPPKDIRELYGVADVNSNAFIIETTSFAPKGPRMLRVKEWVAYELDPEAFPGGRMLWRKRESPWQATEEFWDWLRAAHKIPYTSMGSQSGWELCYNISMLPGAFWWSVKAMTDLAMFNLLAKTGKGPFAFLFAGVVGMLVFPLVILAYSFMVTYTAFTVTIPKVFKGFFKSGKIKIDRVGSDDEKGRLPRSMVCSQLTAENLMYAGLLKRTAPSIWYLPKDFLPEDIGAEGNLFDENAVEGVRFGKHLVEIEVDPEPAGKAAGRKTSKMSMQSIRQSVVARYGQKSQMEALAANAEKSKAARAQATVKEE